MDAGRAVSTAPLASEIFRMGVREAVAALSKGGLIAHLNAERVAHARVVLKDMEPEAVAAMLHDMAGPFNFRMSAKDVDSRLVHSAEKVSTTAAVLVVMDVLAAGTHGASETEAIEVLSEAFCSWIDYGKAIPSQADHQSESICAAQLMAATSGQAIDSAEAARVRCLAVSRFAAALGSMQVALRVPEAVMAAAAA